MERILDCPLSISGSLANRRSRKSRLDSEVSQPERKFSETPCCRKKRQRVFLRQKDLSVASWARFTNDAASLCVICSAYPQDAPCQLTFWVRGAPSRPSPPNG